MPPRPRLSPVRLAALAALALAFAASTGRAASLYSLTDLGKVGNGDGTQFDASGKIVPSYGGPVRTQDGPYSIVNRPVLLVDRPGDIDRAILSGGGLPDTVIYPSPGSGLTTYAYAVNKLGTVVGVMESGDLPVEARRPFVFSRADGFQMVPTPFPYTNGSLAVASSINDAGLIVGSMNKFPIMIMTETS